MLLNRVFILGQIVAFWPVWLWYAQRMLDGSDEPWGLFALISVCWVLFSKAGWQAPTKQVMTICSLIAGVYAVSFSMLPPLLRGMLAVLALSFSFSSCVYGRPVQAGIFGLMLLSLPLIASLQFYGGFPIRIFTAFVSAQLLSLLGYPVTPQGTLLYWLGEVIAVDAPCAGIKMLWTGLLMNFTLAAWRNLGFLATWFCTSATLFSVFIGNIIRATLLFFTESGIVAAPDIAHQAIGIIVFAIVALSVLSFHRFNRGVLQCAI